MNLATQKKTVVERVLQRLGEENRNFILEHECKQILQVYGIPVTKGQLCQSEIELLTSALEIGYPVVLKVVSPDIVHKTEAGGVKVNIGSPDDLAKAFGEMKHKLKVLAPGARVYGFLVQEMVKGFELIIGSSRDSQFGHLVMFGMGGIFVEFLKDISYRLAPLSLKEAEEMIREIKAYPLLAGARGGEKVDDKQLVAILLSISQLVTDFPQITELDLNPTFANGDQIVVADARIFIS